ncbi:MAG: ThuA domain-containing protein [Planctomycetota bacterium]|jgi:type 1 glutamine amidotransferase
MRIGLRTVVAGWIALVPLWGARPAAAGVPDRDVQKITDAMPKKATAKPARPRKLLVFNLCRGFRHGSIPWGAKALEIMGRTTGAFETVESSDPSVFGPDSLNQFDAVCMNNTTGQLFNDDVSKKSLLDFVRGGKGIIGIHAATDCFYKWAEYGEMMGGYFWGHPWNEKVAVKLDDPGHPVLAAFGGKGFEVADEIYQFKDPYSRKALHVLLSLDTTKTNMKKGGIRRTDGDFAVAWVRSYGKGRVFYCSLGHRNEIFWNPAILRHYLDGIQFAMGDLGPGASSGDAADPFMGEWKGLMAMRGLAPLKKEIFAQVIGVSARSYQANILESLETPHKRIAEIKGRKVGEKVSFMGGKIEKGILTGRLSRGTFEMKRIVRHSPTEGAEPPAGAVVLLPFSPGRTPSLDEWTNKSWKTDSDGSMAVSKGDNLTRRKLGSMKLHVEFMIPYEPSKKSQSRGNSGVYIMQRYEVQILDSFGLVPKFNDCGSLYRFKAPKVNACFPPGQWQTYDITFHAPKFSAQGTKTKNARITVVQNGVKTHDDLELPKGTGVGGRLKEVPTESLKLQDHAHPVKFRNIWVVGLEGD